MVAVAGGPAWGSVRGIPALWGAPIGTRVGWGILLLNCSYNYLAARLDVLFSKWRIKIN